MDEELLGTLVLQCRQDADHVHEAERSVLELDEVHVVRNDIPSVGSSRLVVEPGEVPRPLPLAGGVRSTFARRLLHNLLFGRSITVARSFRDLSRY